MYDVLLKILERVTERKLFRWRETLLARVRNNIRIYRSSKQVWVEEHMDDPVRQSSRNVEKRHQEQFATWFEKRVTQLRKDKDEGAHDQLFSLARGPDRRVTFYKGYITKGFRFHTKESELSLRSQNSGVIVKGDELIGSVDYYGVIKDIIELEYLGENRVVLYRCDWFDVLPQGRN
ncbi:uncharacterized protein LOC120013795 [Tripterygium wilfordii]|uniref:uncharacterized protein LOC120013795 n=1 Tax=Tripterygium wilfordii TaxID=458696 RepID=UPI0018F7E681|nr:uncharacterized protein LOC120013795 [Tripterygium wilfordii]